MIAFGEQHKPIKVLEMVSFYLSGTSETNENNDNKKKKHTHTHNNPMFLEYSFMKLIPSRNLITPHCGRIFKFFSCQDSVLAYILTALENIVVCVCSKSLLKT